MPNPKAVSALKLTIPTPYSVLPTRNDITRLLFETHKKCANSAEEVLTLKEIAKLNDLYPRINESITIDLSSVVKTMEQLQGMNDAKLLEMIGEENLFDMPALEGTFKEIKDIDEMEAMDMEVKNEKKQTLEGERNRRQAVIAENSDDSQVVE